MASVPKKRKPAATPKVSGIRLFYPVLVSCDLDRKSEADAQESDEKQPERFYDCRVQPVAASDSMNLAVCEFAAGTQKKDVKLVEIKATYYVAFSHNLQMSSAEEDAFLSELASASAWPMFRDLFIHIGSQTGHELPLLPNVPHVTMVEREKMA